MNIWGALQYVGTGLSLVAFVVAAILFAYRARLKNRAEIIKSAPEKERLEAITATAEFFRVDVSGLSRAQQQDIVLTQIHARARRDLLLAVVTLIVAVLLAIVATVAILAPNSTGAAAVVNTTGPVIAPGRDANFNGPTTFGLDEKKTGEQIAAALKPFAAQIAREKGVPYPVLADILSRLGETVLADDPAQIEKKLNEKADEYVALRRQLAQLASDDPRVTALRKEAVTAIDAWDFDLARAKLREATDLDRDAVKELAERAKTRALSAADSLRESARASRIELHYRDAAKDLNEAAELVERFDREAAWNLRIAQASDLYAQGDEFGDNDALTEAISVYRSGLLLAPRSQQPLDWATTQTNLGVALWRLGERERGTAKLEEAVATFREALKERTRERVPLDWATTQTNLGLALRTLGERESGTAKLEEAVAAFREALKEGTSDRVPFDWAKTQNNLGLALLRLGERESGTTKR